MKYFFLLVAILFSLPSFSQTVCQHQIGSCDYYLCRSEHAYCVEKDYFKKFGHKYCIKFEDKTRPKLSPAGQTWLDKVKICLQQELEDILESELDQNSDSCENTEQAAIDSHRSCYLETGYCELSKQDKKKIHRTVIFNLWRPRYLKAAYKLKKSCG